MSGVARFFRYSIDECFIYLTPFQIPSVGGDETPSVALLRPEGGGGRSLFNYGLFFFHL